MITQLILDAFAALFALIVTSLPPLPAEFSGAVASVASSAAALAPSLAALGPVVPFSTINAVLALFPIALTYWLAVSAFRFLLWLFDR